MSSKLIKNGSNIMLTDDKIIGVIRILESGKIQVEAPGMHPAIIIKHLNNIITDIQYASFQMAEVPKVVQPAITVP
jgi:hypothetical protein